MDRTLLVPPAQNHQAPRIQKAFLHLMEEESGGGKRPVQTVSISRDRFIIGSSEGCELRLADAAVSRRHCAIGVDAQEGYFIEDLGSTNGTFVNGIKISYAYLTPGAELQLGGTRLLFEPEQELRALEQSGQSSFGSAVGISPAMRRVFYIAEAYAPTDATVMLTGETGTGKEILAEEIHKHSPRAEHPFLVIDCASLSRELIESELFGHVKGSFTGAATDRTGIFEAAHGGTVFLDEIGDLPGDLQPKLLRVLEKREVRPVGSNEPRKVDVRIICATNKRLDEEVNQGHFREDLFYRLSVVQIELPALRDRPEDIALLISAFAARLGDGTPEEILPPAPPELEVLRRYHWPGNVRELRNLVERAFYAPRRPVDFVAALAQGRRMQRKNELFSGVNDVSEPFPAGAACASFKEEKARLVDGFEKQYFTELLNRNGGNISRTAREAGIERAYLQRLIKKLDIRISRGTNA